MLSGWVVGLGTLVQRMGVGWGKTGFFVRQCCGRRWDAACAAARWWPKRWSPPCALGSAAAVE
eukprot:1758283-Pyramimonas_sp.AAC.1